MPDASRRSIDPPALRKTILWALGVATTVTVDRKQSIARLTLKATNIAETSLTVDGIKYVIDTGRVLIANVGVVYGIDIDELYHPKHWACNRCGSKTIKALFTPTSPCGQLVPEVPAWITMSFRANFHEFDQRNKAIQSHPNQMGY